MPAGRFRLSSPRSGDAIRVIGSRSRTVAVPSRSLAVAGDPTLVPEVLFWQAERAFRLGDLDKAAGFLAPALEQSPDDHRAAALMAEIKVRANDMQEAFAFCMRAVNAAPHIHSYKERFLELARRGLSLSPSAELENAFA